MTNLPRERWPAEGVMALYRCRWRNRTVVQELKSHNRLKAFATRQKAIAEAIWASLLALLVKRRLALTLIGNAELSMLEDCQKQRALVNADIGEHHPWCVAGK